MPRALTKLIRLQQHLRKPCQVRKNQLAPGATRYWLPATKKELRLKAAATHTKRDEHACERKQLHRATCQQEKKARGASYYALRRRPWTSCRNCSHYGPVQQTNKKKRPWSLPDNLRAWLPLVNCRGTVPDMQATFSSSQSRHNFTHSDHTLLPYCAPRRKPSLPQLPPSRTCAAKPMKRKTRSLPNILII